MADTLTLQQRQAVDHRGGKLLVSAAAGSGKTRVLVERLMSYILDPVSPANVDDFLIITYTKAAAAELREKIAKQLTEKLIQMPGNRHLQRQLQRLYLAKISTVHAFCTDLLRENGYRMDIFGDFRVAEETECEQIKRQVLQQILEDSYGLIGSDPDFTAFVDTQGFGRDDRSVPEIVMDVYDKSRCHLNPGAWLSKCVSDWEGTSDIDISQTCWGAYLINDLKHSLSLHKNALNNCIVRASACGGMEKPVALLEGTVAQMEKLMSLSTWDDFRQLHSIDFGTLSFSKNVDPLLKERIKAIRNACKAEISEKLAIFNDDTVQLVQDFSRCAAAVRGLVNLVIKFDNAYTQVKRSRRIMDFSDLEHQALDLLVGKDRKYVTAAAREIGSRFVEVMVDEYQDSNEVQDAIFSALTDKKQNCFMVGDVKQSIYQFRLADPSIFLHKYNTYAPAGAEDTTPGTKVLLSTNFRSTKGVISGVNDVFSVCMSQEVGGLAYGDDEKLHPSPKAESVPDPAVTLHAIEVDSDTYREEAGIVASEIAKLLDGTHMVREGESLRPAVADDIVILLRSPASTGGEFAYALAQRGIKCQFGMEKNVMQSEEVQYLRSLLETIDNPLQDIPLVATMMGRIFAFTADEMAALRKEDVHCPIFTLLEKSTNEKAVAFLQKLTPLRRTARLENISALIGEIFRLTKMDTIYEAMGQGDGLKAFVQMVSDAEKMGRRDLRSFLEFLESMDKRGYSAGAAKSSGAVTITSIHKSKGLEYPIVYLCGLSKGFNREDLKEQVLCDKELGLGVTCVDNKNRVRYPSVAKRAIALKKTKDSISEELRVLYVAMTRAKDRLIMTFASNRLDKILSDISLRMDMSDRELLAEDVSSMGDWVLQSAMGRIEAGELFNISGRPESVSTSEPYWKIDVLSNMFDDANDCFSESATVSEIQTSLQEVQNALNYTYPHLEATKKASKLTATQLKGRDKDKEAAEHTSAYEPRRNLRKPTFVEKTNDRMAYGTAMHKALQHLVTSKISNLSDLETSLSSLRDKGLLTEEEYSMLNRDSLLQFFVSPLGMKIQSSACVLREFKFSVLSDGPADEKVLLQGVVDCAIIDPDGITVVDFKTDYVTDSTVADVAEKYFPQITAYAEALSRIYKKPIKKSVLYFLRLGTEIPVY